MNQSDLNAILNMCKKRIDDGKNYDDIKSKNHPEIFAQIDNELELYKSKKTPKPINFWQVKASMSVWENDGTDEFINHTNDGNEFKQEKVHHGLKDNIDDVVFYYNGATHTTTKYPTVGIYLVCKIISKADHNGDIKLKVIKNLKDNPFVLGQTEFSELEKKINALGINGKVYKFLESEYPQKLYDLIMNNGYEEFIPEEINQNDAETLIEGAKKQITVNAYERNPKARQECVKKHGYICAICKFDFEKSYGEIGKNFIHVHHLREISSIAENYEVDPEKDLIPVCPNCHAMLHKQKPAYTINEMKKMLNK
ncbi:MAG: HNH endonuclease [Sulfuricurvum sp.]|uniref:HNH endonuclease n=1 Tax=Sulfuricurvum sp. TaxID=2025608 RepID=UPI002617190D|nr:HNH endonuclease [Sulfuricurvum sp.]MDD2368307.1 HNH endonuclease [Sulfuricurvum sp.]MDD2949510.1 HNH endonuclease [Sulfuricurvum sp.]MDD5117733.1 HNH endonuclease [Sulfuricurvum sp.]